MAYESEVRRQARMLGDVSRNARRERNKAGLYVNDAGRWWKGKGREAFAEEYWKADRDAETFLRHLGSAVDGLCRLPSLIQRAERERREAELYKENRRKKENGRQN